MTTEKNPYESDDARETQALPPVDPTIELPVTSGEVADDEADPDTTQVVESGPVHEDDLADEIFRGEATQALPVTDPTLALPVVPPTHAQAYPVQDAPVDPEPVPVAAASSPPLSTQPPAPGPTPAVDPAAQWNVTAQQKAQLPPEDDPRDRGLRVGTVVWGFVIVAVGAGILALALGATYDLDLALIALLSVAGLVLVVSSIVSSSRRSARERARR